MVGKIAQHSFDSLEQASDIGEKLGEKITEISQKQGKQNLDGGIIRQLSHQKELYSLVGLSAEQPKAIEQSSFQDDLTSATPVQVIEETDSAEQPVREETSSELENQPEQPVREETPSAEIIDASEQPSNEETPSEEEDLAEQPSGEETPSAEITDAPEQPSHEETPSEEITDASEQPSHEETTSAEIADTLEQPSNEENISEAEESPEHSEPNEESLIHS